MYYDRHGDQITMDEWSLLFNDHGYKIVQQTDINAAFEGLTISLGIDHNVTMTGPPLIFETMVFRNGDGDETYRYSTIEEAIAGHEDVLRSLTKKESTA